MLEVPQQKAGGRPEPRITSAASHRVPHARQHFYPLFMKGRVRAQFHRSSKNCLSAMFLGLLMVLPGPADKLGKGTKMIRLTRLNHSPIVLNSDLIEHIDVTPDTVVTLTTGQILRVRETADEVVERIVQFRRKVFGPEVRNADLCQDRPSPELFKSQELGDESK
jgi:flagellar protein FlbD